MKSTLKSLKFKNTSEPKFKIELVFKKLKWYKKCQTTLHQVFDKKQVLLYLIFIKPMKGPNNLFEKNW